MKPLKSLCHTSRDGVKGACPLALRLDGVCGRDGSADVWTRPDGGRSSPRLHCPTCSNPVCHTRGLGSQRGYIVLIHKKQRLKPLVKGKKKCPKIPDSRAKRKPLVLGCQVSNHPTNHGGRFPWTSIACVTPHKQQKLSKTRHQRARSGLGGSRR